MGEVEREGRQTIDAEEVEEEEEEGKGVLKEEEVRKEEVKHLSNNKLSS